MSGERIDFDEAALAATADSYDPAIHQAPIVVGHPANDSPAYGWVDGIAFIDGALVATPADIDAGFAELVKAGRYRKVSASFYKPDAPNNPTPGVYTLRHVGFLGAQPPAVKGLKPVAFNEAAGDVLVFGEQFDRSVAGVLSRIREWIISTAGLEDADKAVPAYEIDYLRETAGHASDTAATPGFSETDTTTETTTEAQEDNEEDPQMDQAEIDERQQELDARHTEQETRDAEFAEREAAQVERQRALDEREAGAMLDGLIAEGRFPPGHRDTMAAFMSQLDDSDAVSFADAGDDEPPTARGFFESFLRSMPAQIDFSERSHEDGEEVDATNAEAVAEQAVAYQEEMRGKGVTVSTDRAVRHVLEGAKS